MPPSLPRGGKGGGIYWAIFYLTILKMYVFLWSRSEFQRKNLELFDTGSD
jgi:hypothetical protein